MSARARQLHATADRQVAELADRLAGAGDADLKRPCPGRARLGDGTVGAVAAHATDNYGRIARFVAAYQAGSAQQPHGSHGQTPEASEVDAAVLLVRLAWAREVLARIRRCSDDQLDSQPPDGAMRFADGERSFEQVISALFKHQRHQIDAIEAALS